MMVRRSRGISRTSVSVVMLVLILLLVMMMMRFRFSQSPVDPHQPEEDVKRDDGDRPHSDGARHRRNGDDDGTLQQRLPRAAPLAVGRCTPLSERLKKESPKKGDRKLRVACVGDSITYGNGSHKGVKNKHPKEGNYPVVLRSALKEMLGRDVSVDNYGVRGATADNETSMSYRRTDEFHRFQRNLVENEERKKPDLVLLMLGTNDSKPRYWVSSVHFERMLLDMCRALVVPFPEVSQRLVMMVPPPAAPDPRPESRSGCCNVLGNINATRIEREIRASIKKVAEQLGVMVVDFGDLWRESYKELDADTRLLASFKRNKKVLRQAGVAKEAAQRVRQLLHDGIHPTKEGHQLMATYVARRLCAT